MKKYYQLLLVLGIGAASLSSCSRANYAFNPAGPSYLGTARVHTSEALVTPEPELMASADAATPAPQVAPARVAAAALARPHAAPLTHRAVHTSAASAAAVAEAAVPVTAQTTLTKAERKELKQALRQAVQQQKKATSPSGVSADGKSQLVAALLCFFLGALGVHDFYLGYIGKGILQIFLSLIVIGFILVIIDLVRILTGSLKPKNGEYEKKL